MDVYATPAMIGLMERAALSAVALHLPKGSCGNESKSFGRVDSCWGKEAYIQGKKSEKGTMRGT